MDQMYKFIDILPKEIGNSLIAMSKTDDLNKKKVYSEIVLNLCQSLGVFIDAMDMLGIDYDDDNDLIYEEMPLELHKPRKKARRKNKRIEEDDMPF